MAAAAATMRPPKPTGISKADTIIEPEEASADSDETAQNDAFSFTTSVTSGITDYTFENGRRYHAYKSGAYYLPNDEAESNRLDLLHHLCTSRLGGELYLAPLPKGPKRILDIGTGTGIWAIEMGDLHPESNILGNDLSPIQPNLTPPNVRFEIDDVESPWVYGEKFDFVHCRYMAGSIKDWPNLMKQVFRFVKPGGWAEFQDFTMTFYTTSGKFTPETALGRWATGTREGVRKMGLEPEPGPLLEGWIKDAGFTNVEGRVLPIPVGMWPRDQKMKEIGAFDLINFQNGLEANAMRVFTAIHGWKPEDVHVLIAEAVKDLKNRNMRCQHDFYVVYGQKPLDAE